MIALYSLALLVSAALLFLLETIRPLLRRVTELHGQWSSSATVAASPATTSVSVVGGLFDHLDELWERLDQKPIESMTPSELIATVRELRK